MTLQGLIYTPWHFDYFESRQAASAATKKWVPHVLCETDLLGIGTLELEPKISSLEHVSSKHSTYSPAHNFPLEVRDHYPTTTTNEKKIDGLHSAPGLALHT